MRGSSVGGSVFLTVLVGSTDVRAVVRPAVGATDAIRCA
jgi:hypothetical protein